MLLSDLSASGVPVDADSIAAAMVIDAASRGQIPMAVLHRELGMQVCILSQLHFSSNAALTEGFFTCAHSKLG